MDICNEVRSELSYMAERRRWFHTWPELSGKEDGTAASICEELEHMGIRYTVVPNGGILGFIDGEASGCDIGDVRTVLLRADMDALPVQENECNLKRKRTCISKNEGVSHVCGHDSHLAMLLGTARILARHAKEIKGRIILMFERGEEGTFNVGFLHRYMHENGIEPDTCFGLHAYAPLETGKLYIHPGAVMAGVMFFHITLTGKGGHGARPDAANNPVDCFTAVYDGVSKLRLRCASPFSPLTFSVGQVNSGKAGNIIPDDIVFSGTVRFFNTDTALRFREEMVRLIANTAEAYGCAAGIDISNPCFPVINDDACTEIAREAVAGVFGPSCLAETEPWMVSESMCLSLKLWPGVFVLLGIRNDEWGSGAENHSALFDIDEEAMIYGAGAAVAYTLAYLDDPAETAERKWKGSLEELYESAGVPLCR